MLTAPAIANNAVQALEVQPPPSERFAATGTRRIDDVIPRDEPVSLIKIDVEGHEYLALVGALRTIRERRPVIVSEFSPAGLKVNSRRSGTEYLQLL